MRLIALIILLIPNLLLAQTKWIEPSDEDLAIEFFQTGEYEKALSLFEDLIKDNEKSHLKEYYFNCLLKLKKYSNAERYLKGEIRKEAYEGILKIDLGYVYSLQEEHKKARKEYDKVIDELKANDVYVQSIAAAFERRMLDEYAIKTYQTGRKLVNSPDAYSNKLAEIYGSQGDISKMMDEYVLYLKYNANADEEVKNALAFYTESDATYDVIKAYLLKKTQQNPDSYFYNDLLGWLFVTKKEFFAAYTQLKSIDKRLGENGKRLFDLATICVQNKEYKVAEQCFEYIKEIGRNSPYYFRSMLSAIEMKYLRVTDTKDFDKDELLGIETDFKKFIEDRQVPFNEKHKGYLRLAEIQARYLNKVDDAIALLEGLEERGSMPKTNRANIKLGLADLYLLRGDIWDAKLKYWQVEKDFQDNPIGHRAKFMKAKISFYTGEFELAKAMLDVLKGSTSELIANDALQLSQLIQDNWGLDTTTTPIQLYADADLLIYMKRYDDALKKLDTITEFFPGHTLQDEIHMARAKIFEEQRNFDAALKEYKIVYENFNYDILADDALYKAADILQYIKKEEKLALDLLEKLILGHQDSVHAVDAKKRYRELKKYYPDEEIEPVEAP